MSDNLIVIPELAKQIKVIERGGPGSGHHGHRGRPGEVGGSLPDVSGFQGRPFEPEKFDPERYKPTSIEDVTKVGGPIPGEPPEHLVVEPGDPITITGLWTAGPTVTSGMNFQQRGAGRYISLDRPFNPGGENILHEVKVDIPLNTILDPNGVIPGTDVEASREAWSWGLDRLNELGWEWMAEQDIDREYFQPKVWATMGYRAIAGWIEPGLPYMGRELVVWDKGTVKARPMTDEEVAEAIRKGNEYEGEIVMRGGPGSGHHGHRGRPGEVGGSLPSGEVAVMDDWPEIPERGWVSLGQYEGEEDHNPWGWVIGRNGMYYEHISEIGDAGHEGILPSHQQWARGMYGWQNGTTPMVLIYAESIWNSDEETISSVFLWLDDLLDGVGHVGPMPVIAMSRDAGYSYYTPALEPIEVFRGGVGSGHHGHKGRPGEVGGSLPSGAIATAIPDAPKHFKRKRIEGPDLVVWVLDNEGKIHHGFAKDLDPKYWSHGHSALEAREGLVWSKPYRIQAGLAGMLDGKIPYVAVYAELENTYAWQTFFPAVDDIVDVLSEFYEEFDQEYHLYYSPDTVNFHYLEPVLARSYLKERGGPGSGHHGHKGRPGKVGGSLPSGATAVGDHISDYLKTPQTPLWEPVNIAFRAIEKVHGVNPLPPLRIYRSKAKKRRGVYSVLIAQDGGWIPEKLGVVLDPRADSPHDMTTAMTMAHEIGHLLDHAMFGRDRYFTSEDMIDGGAAFSGQEDKLLAISPNPDEARAYQNWWKAIQESESYKKMQALEAGIGYLNQEGNIVRISELEYTKWPRETLLRTEFFRFKPSVVRSWKMADEYFARSYAQYIATRSGDNWMNNELESERILMRRGFAPTTWEDDDFEPIADAFDELFDALGLLR